MKKIFIFCLFVVSLTFLSLAGCKIKITVPEGGNVTTESGSYDCRSGQVCTIDVYDIFFDETFIAVPDSGSKFLSWRKKHRGLCGGNNKPCHLFTTGFLGNDALMAILESDTVFYLTPVFEAEELDFDADGIADKNDPYPYGVLAVGGRQACAITTSGVRCWGTSFVGLMDRVDPQSKVPKFLSNPSQVSASISKVCVLDDLGVWCWGTYDWVPLMLVPGLTPMLHEWTGES